jgi:hypothetical protein
MEGSTDISFQTQFLQFVWISSNKIHSKINVFPNLSSENCEINSLNLTRQGLSNNTPKFRHNFQFWFYLSLPTLAHQELSEDTESMTWSTGSFGRLQCDKIKQRGVSHCGLAIYSKKHLKSKEEWWKFKHFTRQKYKLQKNPLKETKILQDIITL